MPKHFVAIGCYTSTSPDHSEPRVVMYDYMGLPREISPRGHRMLPGFFTTHTKDPSPDMLLHWMRRNGCIQYNSNLIHAFKPAAHLFDEGVPRESQQIKLPEVEDPVNMITLSAALSVDLAMTFKHLYVGHMEKEDIHIHLIFLPVFLSLTHVKDVLNNAVALQGVVYNGALTMPGDIDTDTGVGEKIEARLYTYINGKLPPTLF